MHEKKKEKYLDYLDSRMLADPPVDLKVVFKSAKRISGSIINSMWVV